MRINFKRLFDKKILERGLNYYKERRVSHLIKNCNIFTASVEGTHTYAVSIDLATENFRCNCPYDNYCKHIAAVFYKINSTKNIESVDTIKKQLSNRSKEELALIIKNMLVEEPRLRVFLLSPDQQILEKIKNINEYNDGKEWQEFYDYIPDKVEEILEDINKVSDRATLLLKLLERVQQLNEKYDNHGSTEDSVIAVLEVLEEIKKTLKQKDAVIIESQVKDILGKEYKPFTEYLEGE